MKQIIEIEINKSVLLWDIKPKKMNHRKKSELQEEKNLFLYQYYQDLTVW